VASFPRLWRAGTTGRGRGAGKEAATTTTMVLAIRRGARGGRRRTRQDPPVRVFFPLGCARELRADPCV
jgi:hypothetical protein